MTRWACALIAAAALLLTACGAAPGGQPGTATASPAAEQNEPGTPAATPIPAWQPQPDQFVSLQYAPRDQQTSGPMGFLEVALGDTRTGAVIRRLLPATTSDGMQVSGLALDRAGDLWITYSKGPRELGRAPAPTS
jgi:hypothetical protein